MNISLYDAIKIALKYGLLYEVCTCIEDGLTPFEALLEWDIAPFQNDLNALNQEYYDGLCDRLIKLLFEAIS